MAKSPASSGNPFHWWRYIYCTRVKRHPAGILAIKQRIIGKFHAFRMKFISDDADLDTAPLLTASAANRTDELQGEVVINHMEFLLRIL
jgi:hypothetical protein